MAERPVALASAAVAAALQVHHLLRQATTKNTAPLEALAMSAPLVALAVSACDRLRTPQDLVTGMGLTLHPTHTKTRLHNKISDDILTVAK